MKLLLYVRGGGLAVSPPARGRGLKLDPVRSSVRRECVAPRAGAWIETTLAVTGIGKAVGRPPRGGVD